VEQDRAFVAEARRHSALARRVRNRALLDIVLIGAATGSAAHLAEGAHEALLAASLALSIGILVYVIRRDRDLTALAGVGRWREAALDGRGLTLEEWQGGTDLAPWEQRGTSKADRAAEARGAAGDSDSRGGCG
jgi:hypothetical protein